MNFVRSLVYEAWLYASMLAVAGYYFIPTLIDSDKANKAARVWSRCAVWGVHIICGVRVRYEGLEHLPTTPVLVASKHQAMLDIYAPMLLLRRPAIVLKKELLAMPAFGWFAQRAGMIPVDREANATALRSMLKMARARSAEGRPIFIFPEGTRAEPGATPDYKSGVAALYRDLGLPCVPVALNTGLVWPAHGVTRTPGTTTIRFLPPIPPGLSREEFMVKLQGLIETESNALLAQGAR